MAGLLFLLFLTVPIIEIALFIEVGGLIGLWPTIAIVVLTAFAGTALLRWQGLDTLRRARDSLERDRFPIDEMFDGLCLAAAGALLLTPGFFTDVVGLALFVPPVRAALRRRIVRYVAEHAEVRVGAAHASSEWQSGPVIDGEYRDVSPDHGSTDGADDVRLPKPPAGRDGG